MRSIKREESEESRDEALTRADDKRKRCTRLSSGNDNTLTIRGAGGTAPSVVIYRLTEPMKGRAAGASPKRKRHG